MAGAVTKIIDGRAMVGAGTTLGGVTLGAATVGSATLGTVTGALTEGTAEDMALGTTVEMRVLMLMEGPVGRVLGKAEGVATGSDTDGTDRGTLGTARLVASGKAADSELAGTLTGTLGTTLGAIGNDIDGAGTGTLGTGTLGLPAGRGAVGELTGRVGTDVATGMIEDRREGSLICLGDRTERLESGVRVGLITDGSVKIPVPVKT